MEKLTYPERTKEIARAFMLGELIAAASGCFQTLAKPWRQLSQAEQQEVMARFRQECSDAVHKAVEVICSDGRYVYRAQVAQVSFKDDGVKATIELANTDAAHDLADRAGNTVLIVNEDGRSYDGVDPAQLAGDDDQRPLFDDSRDAATTAMTAATAGANAVEKPKKGGSRAGSADD